MPMDFKKGLKEAFKQYPVRSTALSCVFINYILTLSAALFRVATANGYETTESARTLVHVALGLLAALGLCALGAQCHHYPLSKVHF